MDRWIVFTIGLGCVLYAEPGEGLFFQSFLLPIGAIASVLYLLGLIPCLIITAGGASLYFSDLNSSSIFWGVILPLSFMFWLLVLIYWAWKAGNLKSSGSPHSGGDSGSGGDIGCDG
ncbi:MAG: hypothetical protein V7739_14430 [Motiliproteus sp.]